MLYLVAATGLWGCGGSTADTEIWQEEITYTALSHGELVLNLADATLSYQGQKAELTKNEFRILQVLLENSGRIVSREMLMKRLWDSEMFVDDNTLTVNITRIRRKLTELGLDGLIRTQKGMGYVID